MYYSRETTEQPVCGLMAFKSFSPSSCKQIRWVSLSSAEQRMRCMDFYHMDIYTYANTLIPQIAIAIGVLTSNRGGGRRTTFARWTWHQNAIAGCSAIAGCQCSVLWLSGRGAIAGCHCRVQWTWCHCRVPLQVAIVVCYGWVDVVPLQGAIAGCSGRGAIAGCRCRLPL